jgi:hypothetical protein
MSEKSGVVEAMKKVLMFAAVGEAATGLALLIVPSFVAQLLLGEGLDGVAIPVARVAGIALIALGIACWPGPPVVGMLTYSAAVMLYLAYGAFDLVHRERYAACVSEPMMARLASVCTCGYR